MARKRKRKTLGQFNDGGDPVRAWFDARVGAVCFRKRGSRKVVTTSLRDIYDKTVGQIVMPFV